MVRVHHSSSDGCSVARERLPVRAGQAHAVPFDRGVMERDVVRDETSAERKSRLEKRSKNIDPSTLALFQAVTHAPAKAIAAMTQVPGSYRWKQKRRERTVANPVSGIMLLRNAVSLMTTKRGSFVFRIEYSTQYKL